MLNCVNFYDMIFPINKDSGDIFMTYQQAKRTALLVLCFPLAATLSFIIATASVPAGTGLWGRVCTVLVWYVFFYCGYFAPFVGIAGAAASVWAAFRSSRRAWVLLAWTLSAALHLVLAWWSHQVFQMLMSV